MDHDELFAFAHDLCETAARETLSRFRTGAAIDNKEDGGFDPVTAADREAERALRDLIAKRYPEHGIRGEEFPETAGEGSYRWVLDPVDGTRAFICGVPVWTTLIGLEKDRVPLFGIIDQPHLGERWTGWADAEARLEVKGKLAAMTSAVTDLSEARLMITDMRAGEYFVDAEADAVARLAHAVKVTRQGLDSYGFGLVASGQLDLVVEAGLKWHDIAAVVPVIKAAGGHVCDWRGGEVLATEGSIQVVIAATKPLADAAIRELNA